MAGIEDLIGGGVVGTLCSELYNVLVTLIKKTKEFNPLLEAIKSTVGGLESLIPQIEDPNEKLKISNKETDRLKKILSDGIKLVGECSEYPKWYNNAKYTDKLTALDEALERELDMLTAHAARDSKETLGLARENHDQLVESARDGREKLGMARKYGYRLVELARDGREKLGMARKLGYQLVELSKYGGELRKNHYQRVGSAREGRAIRKKLPMMMNDQCDEVIHSRMKRRETFDIVREIMKLIYQFLRFWISGLIIIVVVWVILLKFSLPGESKRIATAVLDGIILSRCKVCKSVVDQWARLRVSLVRTYANLPAYVITALCCCFFFFFFILVIRDQYKRGFSRSEVCRLLFLLAAILFCCSSAGLVS